MLVPVQLHLLIANELFLPNAIFSGPIKPLFCVVVVIFFEKACVEILCETSYIRIIRLVYASLFCDRRRDHDA
jgi:hypothetical protein